MGSFGNPKPWVPYMNTRDCSQGFCSIYCPQWCYIIYPPPPSFEFSDDTSGPNFSPLVIAIIGILASAFLLVSYYAIISKFCRNVDSTRRRENHDPNEEIEEIQDPLTHEPWHVANNGLDEALIKSITVCKYKKSEGLIEGTDCSVCLSEFHEDENLRLLPKCSHAFHVKCIDTWLRSHSNCPLCRASIAHVNALPCVQLPPAVTEMPPNGVTFSQGQRGSTDIHTDVGEEEIIMQGDTIPKTPTRAASDLGYSEQRETIVEIKEDEYQHIRRSVSMSNLCQTRVSIADVICIDQEEECCISLENISLENDVGSSKMAVEEMRNCNGRSRVVHCVTSPVRMKRSFSSGRFLFTKCRRGQNIVIPL